MALFGGTTPRPVREAFRPPPQRRSSMPAAKTAKKTVSKESPASMGPQPGDKAPAFKLPDENGKSVSLSDFKGKKVVLYFYPKDSTPVGTT